MTHVFGLVVLLFLLFFFLISTLLFVIVPFLGVLSFSLILGVLVFPLRGLGLAPLFQCLLSRITDSPQHERKGRGC